MIDRIHRPDPTRAVSWIGSHHNDLPFYRILLSFLGLLPITDYGEPFLEKSPMDVGALAQAISCQAVIGSMVVEMLNQSTELIQQEMATMVSEAQVIPVSLEGLGENLDVIA